MLNKIAKYTLLIAFSALLFVTTSQAAMVTITWAPGHSSSGGEFVMTPTTGPSFHSFCLEKNEYLNVGGIYDYTIGNSAIAGGVSGGNPDPLSVGSAWLYTRFLSGGLTGYLATTTQQTDLQNAFWMLEGELTLNTSNPWITLAQTSLGSSINLLSDNNGQYDAVVWNLYNANGTPAQSQIGPMTPVPEPTTILAGSLLLLPFGASILRVYRRK